MIKLTAKSGTTKKKHEFSQTAMTYSFSRYSVNIKSETAVFEYHESLNLTYRRPGLGANIHEDEGQQPRKTAGNVVREFCACMGPR